ncbi:MAG: GlxA family transcriptional regulator [Pseudomonadota bacterium]|nr:GlxA family transcriptional regulator [Pseudomonadota bacterium]
MPPEPDREPHVFVFLLVEGHSMMSLASAVEPLRSLNRLAGREAYRWRLASLDGTAVTASNGIAIPAEPVEPSLDGADYLFVCGGLRIQSPDERRYLRALRNAARRGIPIGSLSTGTHLLARAGLLDGYRCTIHWENRPAFEEEFPKVVCTDKIYEIDRDRLTCSGGTAAMDLMLHLIADRHGQELARQVANQFHHERIRDERDDQRGGRLHHLANLPITVRSAVELMQRHIDEPIAIAEVAARTGLSARQIERLFLRYLKMTPARYYLALRIDRARELLIYSDRPILDVAVATGFASTSHFSQWFKRFYGARPSELRGRSQPRPT